MVMILSDNPGSRHCAGSSATMRDRTAARVTLPVPESRRHHRADVLP